MNKKGFIWQGIVIAILVIGGYFLLKYLEIM